MIFSAQQTFSDQQIITATARSTNVIDLGSPDTPHGGAAPLKQDVGKGTPIPINVQITEGFDNLTSLDVAVEVGATDTLGTVLATQNILLADLVAGKTLYMQCLPNGVDQRYLGLRYTVNGAAPTVGRVHAGISMGNQTNH
ncbi:MAG: Bbp16 family capsid cement protein [Candidatus Thiodiazotropha endolucinida]